MNILFISNDLGIYGTAQFISAVINVFLVRFFFHFLYLLPLFVTADRVINHSLLLKWLVENPDSLWLGNRSSFVLHTVGSATKCADVSHGSGPCGSQLIFCPVPSFIHFLMCFLNWDTLVKEVWHCILTRGFGTHTCRYRCSPAGGLNLNQLSQMRAGDLMITFLIIDDRIFEEILINTWRIPGAIVYGTKNNAK